MMSGTVDMSQDPSNSTRTRINLSLSGPKGNMLVNWALVPGRCGTARAPVLPINDFQPLELPTSARGDLSVSVPYAFPTDGDYHVAIYSGNRAQLTDVVACATLSLKKK